MRSSFLLPLACLGLLAAGCQTPPPVSTTPNTPLNTKFQTRSWDTGGNTPGKELVSDHYRIYTTAASQEILSWLPGFMEAAFDNYARITQLPARPSGQPMPVYMMGTRREWAALTRSIVGSQWDLYSAIQAGGYCYKGVCVFWDMGGVGAMSVASHEGMHQFLSHRMKDPLPMWLEEGLTTMAEGYQVDGASVQFTPHRNPARFTDLRNALVNDWWIPVEKLLPMDGGDATQLGTPERAVGYYGQIWALGQFLRSDPAYAPKRLKMLADAEAGLFHQALKLTPLQVERLRQQGRGYNRTVSAPLFKHYMDEDLAGFDRKYKAFARKLAKLG
jgi:hypothetical protein